MAKYTAYEYNDKLYVPTGGTEFIVFDKDKKQINIESLSKEEYGMALSFGRRIELDKTDIHRLQDQVKEYEKTSKNFFGIGIHNAMKVEKDAHDMSEKLNNIEKEVTIDEGGHRETEFTDQNSKQRNNERSPHKKDEYSYEETYYGYDEDSRTSGRISGAYSRDDANAKARVKAETGEWGKDVKIKNDLRDGNTLSEVDTEYAREMGYRPDEHVHGDKLTEEEEQEITGIHSMPPREEFSQGYAGKDEIARVHETPYDDADN